MLQHPLEVKIGIVLPLSASGLIRPDIELLHQARVLVEILAGETRKILRQASGDLRRALVEMRARAAVGQRLADGGIQARDQCRWSAERNAAYQDSSTRPGKPDSSSVGTSGRLRERTRPVCASS